MPGNDKTKAACIEEGHAARLYRKGEYRLDCIIKSHLSIIHGISTGALAKIMRAVLPDDSQAIMVMPMRKDIEAA